MLLLDPFEGLIAARGYGGYDTRRPGQLVSDDRDISCQSAWLIGGNLGS